MSQECSRLREREGGRGRKALRWIELDTKLDSPQWKALESQEGRREGRGRDGQGTMERRVFFNLKLEAIEWF